MTGSFLSSYLSYKAFPKSLPAQGKLVVWFSEISELRSVSDRLIPDEAYCDSSVAELFVSGEDFYKYLLINRKSLNLSLFDLTLFGYLFHLSRTRVFVKTTIAELAEDIQEPYSKVAKSIQVFISLDLMRKVQYRGDKGIMISPHAINNGSNEKKSFKLKLWEEVKIIRSKSTFSGIHYPIRRKLHS